MFGGFRLGRLLGIPVMVKWSFVALLAVVALTMGGASGVFTILLAFASVLLHELGHAVVARSLDVRVGAIELHFFGGAARLLESPKRASDEALIAAAGPAVSFALAGIALVGVQLTGAPVLALLGWINLVIGAFNLLPALPMDGGRILRALLSSRMGYQRATVIAARVARWVAGAMILAGIAFGQFFLGIIGGVVWLMASTELAVARFGMGGYRQNQPHGQQEQHRQHPEVEVLDVDGEWIDAGGGASYSPPSSPPSGESWTAGGFVIRRNGRGFSVEPIE